MLETVLLVLGSIGVFVAVAYGFARWLTGRTARRLSFPWADASPPSDREVLRGKAERSLSERELDIAAIKGGLAEMASSFAGLERQIGGFPESIEGLRGRVEELVEKASPSDQWRSLAEQVGRQEFEGRRLVEVRLGETHQRLDSIEESLRDVAEIGERLQEHLNAIGSESSATSVTAPEAAESLSAVRELGRSVNSLEVGGDAEALYRTAAAVVDARLKESEEFENSIDGQLATIRLWGAILLLSGGPPRDDARRSDLARLLGQLGQALGYFLPDAEASDWRALRTAIERVCEFRFQQRLGLYIPTKGELFEATAMTSEEEGDGVVAAVIQPGIEDLRTGEVLRKASVRLGGR